MLNAKTKKISDTFGYFSAWTSPHDASISNSDERSGCVTKNSVCVGSDFSNNAKVRNLSPNGNSPVDGSELELRAANDRCDSLLGSMLGDQFFMMTFGTMLPFYMQGGLGLTQIADLTDQFWIDRLNAQKPTYEPGFAPAHLRSYHSPAPAFF